MALLRHVAWTAAVDRADSGVRIANSVESRGEPAPDLSKENPPMSSSRRIAALTSAAVLALGAATVIPAAASSPSPSGTTAVKTSVVTLITGDVVEVTDAGSGKKAATVSPAAGREGVSFHTVEADGGLRVLPSDAVPYISTGVLDVNLFDVDELIADGYGESADLPLIVKDTPGVRTAQTLAGTTTTRQLPSIGG